MVQWEGLAPIESTCIIVEDLMNLNPAMWKQFENNNLQKLWSFQPEENDVETYGGYNCWRGYPFGLRFYGELFLKDFIAVSI